AASRRSTSGPAAFPSEVPIDVVAEAASRSAPVPVDALPPEARPSPAPALVLQAITERDGQPIAIVNDHLVRVGDEVDGIRVLAIRVDEVEVEFHGRRTTLR